MTKMLRLANKDWGENKQTKPPQNYDKTEEMINKVNKWRLSTNNWNLKFIKKSKTWKYSIKN